MLVRLISWEYWIANIFTENSNYVNVFHPEFAMLYNGIGTCLEGPLILKNIFVIARYILFYQ